MPLPLSVPDNVSWGSGDGRAAHEALRIIKPILYLCMHDAESSEGGIRL